MNITELDAMWVDWILLDHLSPTHNPSDRAMALGSTQTLTEMSTRSISWG